jgi:hypothetical protein
MGSPTQQAENYFRLAYERAISAAGHTKDVEDDTGIAIYDIAACLSGLAKGFGEMAIGIRATYQMLERLEQKFDENARQNTFASLTR